jgi:hypothetical protein
MSTATLDIESPALRDESFQYRALHTGAVIGFVLSAFTAIFTLIAGASSPEACIGVSLLNGPALSLCMWSRAKIRREPGQYTGHLLSLVGMVVAFVFLIGGITYGSYVYVTEVPDGYTRISFNAMKPDALDERGGHAVPPDVAALSGKKVFIKGYIRPDSITQKLRIKEFLLVRDDNQCCFGDLSTVKYYDQIDVDMIGSLTVDYKERALIRVGGILKVEPENAARGPMALAPVFSLQADYAE